MIIRALGGFREVGRNAVLLDAKKKLLLDYGLKVETGETPMPAAADALIACHPHLDHVGSIPVLFRKTALPVYATAATIDQSRLLLKDSVKVARLKGRPEIFGPQELERMAQNENRITYGQRLEIGPFDVDIVDAGHIPGSVMAVVEVDGKRILYTSDFNTLPTRLLNGAQVKGLKDIDVLITESTYASRDHEPRADVERKLVELVHDTIGNDGIAIIPVFAVGRAAEILMVLHSAKPGYPVYIDGMARDASEIILHYPELLRDPKALQAAMDKVVPLHSEDERAHALKSPCAIITTGGCLDGGPAVGYIRRLYSRPECSLIFTGFQIPRTAGRYLLDTGRFVMEDVDLAIKMGVHSLDFSAHSGRTQLLDFVKKIRPGTVICMHGDYCERFATEIHGRFGIPASAPKNGDRVNI